MYVDFNVEELYPHTIAPMKAHADDMGIDFFSAENETIFVNQRKLVSLGIKASISPGFGMLLKDRSGMASKYGLHVLAGVIDCDYRGEWFVCLQNLGDKPYEVKLGDKIVQGILVTVPITNIQIVDYLDSHTERGEGGFGSTGD